MGVVREVLEEVVGSRRKVEKERILVGFYFGQVQKRVQGRGGIWWRKEKLVEEVFGEGVGREEVEEESG